MRRYLFTDLITYVVVNLTAGNVMFSMLNNYFDIPINDSVAYCEKSLVPVKLQVATHWYSPASSGCRL